MERPLLIFPAVIKERAAVLDHLEEDALDGFVSQSGITVKLTDELAAQSPRVVDVFLDRMGRQVGCGQMFEEWPEQDE
jgi:hypothetical protein